MKASSKLNLMWALPWMIVSWVAVMGIVWLPVFLVGLVVMPIALCYADIYYAPSRLWPEKVVIYFRNPILQELWGNDEDGLCPEWWKEEGGNAWTWYLRNSVSNQRFWPIVSSKASTDTEFIGDTEIRTGACFVAWSGPFVGCRWECTSWGFWFGFAVNPRDAFGIHPLDWRRFGYSTVAQIWHNR